MLVSAAFFKLMIEGCIARRVEDLDGDMLSAIAGSAVPAGHEGLDNLVKDWTVWACRVPNSGQPLTDSGRFQ